MKRNLHPGLYVLFAGMICTVACRKATDLVPENSNVNTSVTRRDTSLTEVNTTVHPYPITPVQDCIYSANYGDSVVYPQSGGNYYIYPQNTQGIQGTYLSWPAGLSINSSTGAINLSLSQSGARYDIGFVQYGTTDTCISQLIVAGTDYLDSVYVAPKGNSTSSPYFNANPNVPSPCQNNNHGNGCLFDYNDFAKAQGVEIDHQTGIIQIANTANKIFGKNPVNGTTVNTTIFYKLNDNSHNDLQLLSLQFVFYNHRADVPAATLATITARRNSAGSNQLLSKGPTPRPPLIVIVRAN